MRNSKIIKTSLIGIVLSASLNGCGNSGNGDAPASNPSPSGEPQALETVPVAAPAAQVQASEPLAVHTLELSDTEVDLAGDFRIKKVERDGDGNFYLAIVSDVKEKPEATAVAGYAILKFDPKGKEVWRYPTLENSISSPRDDARIGSYLLGNLADMHVTEKGEILLIGIKASAVLLTADSGAANLDAAKWPTTMMPAAEATGGKERRDRHGNLIFIAKIRGGGAQANAPIMSFMTKLAAPVSWIPTAIRLNKESQIIIESTTGGHAGGVSLQVQRIDGQMQKVLASACYASQGVNIATGSEGFVNIASSAPEALVKAMTSPLTALIEIKDKKEPEYLTAALQAVSAETGRCWDLVGAKMMVETDPSVRIIKPTVLADGQEFTSRVESQRDLLDSKNMFEEYDIFNVTQPSQFPWLPNLLGAQSQSADHGHARWLVVNGELVYFGLGKRDIFGNRELIMTNGRTIETKAWTLNMLTNSLRAPASLDIMSIGDEVLAAWTDRHLAGETNAGNRALRIAQFKSGTQNEDGLVVNEFEVPEKSGHNGFTSVRLMPGDDGNLVVFSTVGTSAKPGDPVEQASLLIGFTK